MSKEIKNAFAHSSTSNITALENVLILAEERLEQFQDPNYSDADIIIASDSISQVKSILTLLKAGASITSKETTNIELAKAERSRWEKVAGGWKKK